MKRIKTKIRKFLGIDFTPRKSLYNELIVCYDNLEAQYKYADTLKDEKINLEKKIKILHDKIMEKDRMIWDYQEDIHRLNSIIDDMNCENDKNFEESY